MNLFLDIETIPPAAGDHMARIRAEIKPPGQYKKPESIAQWMAEQGDSAAAEEFGKLALDGLYGEVCVVGFALDDGAVRTVTKQTTEKDLLDTAFRLIDEAATVEPSGATHSVVVVGHNIEWDTRFLFQRAVRLGVRVPRCMRRAFEDPRNHVYDTMRQWAGYKGFVKCKDLSRELLGDPCDDIDGSQVATAWKENQSLVEQHCARDVARVRNLHNLFTGAFQ